MRSEKEGVFAAIEGGGTKFVVGVGHSYQDCVTTTLPTRSSQKTMADVKRTIQQAIGNRRLKGIGIGTFGPIVVDPKNDDYGRVLNTPKPGWQGYNFVSDLEREFGVPVSLETDVSAAALSETTARDGCNNLVYVTVGTGIGGGVFAGGSLISGTLHPELGHIRLSRHPEDNAPGICPFHSDCLEGLASGPSIKARWGVSLSELPENHSAHEIEAYYLGTLCANLVLHYAPEFIVLGGGVMSTTGLLTKVRAQCRKTLGGYIPSLNSEDSIKNLISAPLLGSYSGLQGAFILANNATLSRLND